MQACAPTGVWFLLTRLDADFVVTGPQRPKFNAAFERMGPSCFDPVHEQVNVIDSRGGFHFKFQVVFCLQLRPVRGRENCREAVFSRRCQDAKMGQEK